MEGPKTSSDVVKDAVEDDADARFVKFFDDDFKIFVGTETAVYEAVVTGVIAMGIGFENRREIDGTDAQFRKMRDPLDHL